jgi:hypothetical protein
VLNGLLKGKSKVNAQWNLLCIVNNLNKVHLYKLILDEPGAWGSIEKLYKRVSAYEKKEIRGTPARMVIWF